MQITSPTSATQPPLNKPCENNTSTKRIVMFAIAIIAAVGAFLTLPFNTACILSAAVLGGVIVYDFSSKDAKNKEPIAPATALSPPAAALNPTEDRKLAFKTILDETVSVVSPGVFKISPATEAQQEMIDQALVYSKGCVSSDEKIKRRKKELADPPQPIIFTIPSWTSKAGSSDIAKVIENLQTGYENFIDRNEKRLKHGCIWEREGDEEIFRYPKPKSFFPKIWAWGK